MSPVDGIQFLLVLAPYTPALLVAGQALIAALQDGRFISVALRELIGQHMKEFPGDLIRAAAIVCGVEYSWVVEHCTSDEIIAALVAADELNDFQQLLIAAKKLRIT